MSGPFFTAQKIESKNHYRSTAIHLKLSSKLDINRLKMFISAGDVVPSFKGFTLIMVSKLFAVISILASSSTQTRVILCMLQLSNIELLIIVCHVHSLQYLLEM